ncbi:MAG: hypothetical protein AAF480_13110 [Actinomycetota bacterium]
MTAVALLAASCSGGGLETPVDTLARDETPTSVTGFRLTAPPAGYELCAVTTPSGLFIAPETEASLRVYGDGSLADPYVGPLIGAILLRGGPPEALELGPTREVAVGDSVGLLGGGDGFIGGVLPPDAGRVLTWQWDADRIVQVIVRNDADTDLVALADAVIVEGTEVRIDPVALPEGAVDLGDLYVLEARPQFRFSLDYQLRSDDGVLRDQVTLLGAAGDEASMNAFRFRAADSTPVEINGSPGVVADVGVPGDSRNIATWLVDGELILRVFSLTLGQDQLVEIARSAVFVGEDEWADLRAAFDPATCRF